MKQLILLLTILASVPSIAQKGTTLEEYRYLSKGYVYQLEMGLDAQKEGYLIKKLFKTTSGADLVGLYQVGDAEPRALLVILEDLKSKAKYVCIPNGDADDRVKSLATKDQSNLSSADQLKYQGALNEFLFAALSNPDLKTMAYHSPMSSPVNYEKDETLVSRSANLNPFIKKTPETETIQPEAQMINAKAASMELHGEISTRTILSSTEAYANTRKRGVVAIKICVGMDGEIISAKFTQRGSTTFDSYLKKVALNAAKNLKFAKLDLAEQCGIVNYKF